MEYKFLDGIINTEDIVLPDSDRINHHLLKNHYADAIKALDFFANEGKLLYVHGFLGTGKRQFINYISGFLNKEVIKLEYYCKPSTVCDDILLTFITQLEKNPLSQAIVQTAKLTTLTVKFQQYLSSIKKPFVIILHSFDDIEDENIKLVTDSIVSALSYPNVKIVISTRAMLQDVLNNTKIDKKIFLKAFTKEIFKDFILSNKITGTDNSFEDFYKYTRGYYYYTALAIKIMQAMKISLNDFLAKFALSGTNFDSYLGMTYINLIPTTIRNFFWFLRSLRHGISINALAVLDLYDEFSVNYLKNNLMIYQVDDILYVQSYFQQDIDISIPQKTEIKLHKFIINIYEKQLKESLQTREILLSRQAFRAEIEYHAKRIKEIEDDMNGVSKAKIVEVPQIQQEGTGQVVTEEEKLDITQKIAEAQKLTEDKKFTDALETYQKIISECNVDIHTLAEIKLGMARIYKNINDYAKAQHYYETVESYYKKNDEQINLNYLYYEMTDLYFAMYKNDRAIDTIKKVIYSVDTPQSLMVDSCTLLGNIYNEIKNTEEAYKYYQKALESTDENTKEEKLAELYFKFALACDDKDDSQKAYEYYAKCLSIVSDNPYKALSLSNMGACYFDNGNYSDAKDCFLRAYKIEKNNNNYDGIYYTSIYLAKIYNKEDPQEAFKYMQEAKQCAEFINEDFYILEATVMLGDYYYDKKNMYKKALIEYFKARRIAQTFGEMVDISKIEERIADMKLRLNREVYEKVEQQYG